MAKSESSDKIKLILLAGFLGSGKTTLVNHLLKELSSLPEAASSISGGAVSQIGILVNDFGKLPVDGSILETGPSQDLRVYEIGNGSIFCSCLTSSFIKGLQYFSTQPISTLVIEASGLSDPSGMASILASHGLDSSFEITKTICVTDPERVTKLAHVLPVVKKQIQSADLVIINKEDRVSPDTLKQTMDLVQSVHPGVSIETARFCKVPLPLIFSPSHSTKTGSQESCNTPDTRPGSLFLDLEQLPKPLSTPQFHLLLSTLKEILPNTYRIKGFCKAAATATAEEAGPHSALYYIEDSNGKLTQRKITDRGKPSGITVLCPVEAGIEIQDKLKKLADKLGAPG